MTDSPPTAPIATPGLCALVVEDDASIREIYRKMLEEIGFSVEPCGNGQKALELYQARRYALLVVDYLLPGLDGLRFVEKAFAIRKVPTVVISALLKDRVTIQRLRGMGVQWVLTKPFRLPELRKTLEECARAALEHGA